MERLKIFKIGEVLPYTVQHDVIADARMKKFKKWYPELFRDVTEKQYDGHWVKMYSQRYQLFSRKGLTCVKCGIEGKYFALEKHGTTNTDRYHFNLYGLDKEGKEVLITKDHIVPVSKGGKNQIDNYQVMCTECNKKKGNKLEKEPFRKLGTIRKVSDIVPIPGADFIEIAKVDGWQCIIKKDELKVGDLGVYFEIDSFLPIEPRYEFLRKSSYKKLANGSEGYRLKTIRLRKQLSQGLMLPLTTFPELVNVQQGDDVTEKLNVVLYEPPIPAQLSGVVKGMFPGYISRSDQERIQNLPEYFDQYKDLEFEETEKIDGCLSYKDMITTDKGQIKIGKIVNQKMDVKILSYNKEKNKTEFKKIMNYHKYKNNHQLLRISVGCRGKENRPKYIYCTDNHKFWVSDKWVEAKYLKKKDLVYHLVEKLSYEQEQMLLGMLLGDASITRIGNAPQICWSHSIVQSDYFDYNLKLLNICYECKGYRGGFKGSKENRRAYTYSNLSIKKLIDDNCIINNKKHITERWVNKLSPISLAFWYMDDGSISSRDEIKQRARATLHTQGFPLEEIKLLQKMLFDKFKINSSANNYGKGYRIEIDSNGSEIFFSMIAPYICKSMKYKLPLHYTKLSCIYENHAFKTYESIIETPILEIDNNIPSHLNQYLNWVYDLTIEDNPNYFTERILTHNSSGTMFLNNGVFGVCSRNLELLEDPNNTYWKVAIKLNIEQALRKLNKNIAIQGEVIGEGINKNSYKLKGQTIYVFDIYDIDNHRYLLTDERDTILKELGINELGHVPRVNYKVKIFQECKTMEQLLKRAEGQSKLCDAPREGLVFKAHEIVDGELVSFKVINNEYLLKEK